MVSGAVYSQCRAGMRILIEADAAQQRIILTPIRRATIHSLRGKYKGMLKALIADRRSETLREG
jgi:hypothetical protein